MPSTIWFQDTAKWEAPSEPEPEPEVGNCPGEHGLSKFSTPGDGYGCDKCSNRFESNTTLYGCRECNFDMCGACYFGVEAKPDDDEKKDEEKEEKANATAKAKGKTYLYYKLLALVGNKSEEQLKDLEIPMGELRQQMPEAWQELIAFDIETTLEMNCRQDKIPHGLTSQYDPLDLAKATTSSSKFNSAQHYDYNEYLSSMVLTAYMVDDEFQESVMGIFGIDPRTNAASDDNGDVIKYMRGPVKLMSRCRAKAENDYSAEPFPTSACVLDLNRCTLVFNNFRSLLTGLQTFENKVKHYEGRAIIDIVRDKNGFKEYIISPCYADIKFNVLVRGTAHNIIAEVQFLLQQMKDFKAKAHNLYNITRKEEFIANTSKLLPMLLDSEKALFVHGNAGDSKGIQDLMCVSNKPAKYIMKVDEESRESILLNMCALGKAKALRFLQTIIPSDLFVDRIFYPNRYNSLALEPAVRNQQLLTTKVILSSPPIQARYQKDDDYLFRILYMAIQNYDEKMWAFVTSALNVDDEKLRMIIDHKCVKPEDGTFAEGHYSYHDKDLVAGSCMGEDSGGTMKMIELLGEEAFAKRVFAVTKFNVNQLEECISNLCFEKSKFLLNVKCVAVALAGDENLFFRYFCWVMRSASDEFLAWFKVKFELDEAALRKYIEYDEYPEEPEDIVATLDSERSWSYNDKGIIHWTMWSGSKQRCTELFALIDKSEWYTYLSRGDSKGWEPFAIAIYSKLFDFAEYILDNVEPQYREPLISQGSWMTDEKVKSQLKEWKVKYA